MPDRNMEDANTNFQNPFAKSQVEGKEKTLKYCAWEALKKLERATAEKICATVVFEGWRVEANAKSVSSHRERPPS